MRFITTLIFSLITMSCASSGGFSVPPAQPSQIELMGNLLGQYEDVTENSWGTPDDVRTTGDGWKYSIHLLNEIGRDRNYLVIKYPPAQQYRQAYSIQIAGDPYPDMQPFLGVRLGDSKDSVEAKVGRPSKERRFKDEYVEVDVWEYKDRNYSFEFDMQERLFSIQIFGYDGFAKSEVTSLSKQFEGLRQAVLAKDGEGLMLNHLAPDAEFYHQGEAIRYKQIPREEMTRAGSSMYDYVLGNKTSLYMFFKLEPESPYEVNFRITESGRSFVVYKFSKSEIVEEIVYTFHGGQWKVYEVSFRNVKPV